VQERDNADCAPVGGCPVDVETRTCAAVGDECYAWLNPEDTGLASAQWIVRPTV